MSLDTLLLYIVLAFFYISSPGPAIFLAIANGLTNGMKTVAISSLANILGLFVLSTISVAGLGAILTTSAKLFMIVKIIGAFYLFYLAYKQFKSVGKLKITENNTHKHNKRTSKEFFFEAFFLAVTNPKPIMFFVALFPQFIDIEVAILPQFLILTSTFMFLSFFILLGYGFVAKNAKRYLNDRDKMAWFHRISGGIFIAMGIGLLQLKRVQ